MNQVNQILLVIGLISCYVSSSAQCISKFPYTQDFENFDSLQTNSSCDASIKGDTADGWSQDQSDGGEWRADSAGTASNSTGPGATLLRNGMGVGTDYSPGTTSGTYLYLEATSTAACTGANINLISPCFDFSATGKYYRMTFAYQMFGGSFGGLYVDVYDGTQWIDSIWSHKGSAGTDWQLAEVDLSDFSGKSVILRFRAVHGQNFYSDCAIDAITIREYTEDYDANIYHLEYEPKEYFYVPIKHVTDYDIKAYSRNDGLKGITGVKLKYNSGSGNVSDSISLGSMSAFKKDTTVFTNSFLPKSVSDSMLDFEMTLKETDGSTANNKKALQLNVTKSTYSRDRGNLSGGIGTNSNTIQIGSMYELVKDDTLSSVSFYLNGPVAGDSMKVRLYEFSSNTPGNLVATSNFAVASGGLEWKTVKFNCEQVLKAGEYFVAVEQLVPNANMSLGYSFDCYTQNTCFYGNGTTWTEIGSGGFPVCLLIRLNLDGAEYPEVTISAPDTVCENDIYLAKGGNGSNTYVWGPAGIVKNVNSINSNFSADSTFNLRLTGTNKCGYSKSVSKRVFVEPKPSAIPSSDTVVCKNEPVTLKATTNNTYSWKGGPQNTSYMVNSASSKTYTLEVDSSNGCKRLYNVKVDISVPPVKVNNDTTVCEAQPILLKASGGKSYQWTNGPSSASYSVNPRKNTSYEVIVTDSIGCSESDSVHVTVKSGPPLTTSNDTAICFGQKVTIKGFGAQSYEWTGGPKTAEYPTFPIITKTYYVKGFGSDGCYLRDSVRVEVANVPKVDVRGDTTICEGSSFTLQAKTNDPVRFNWNTGDTTQSIVISPIIETRYRVNVSNSIGCSAQDSMLVSVDPLPIAEVSWTLNKRSVTFTNNSKFGTTHSWDFGNGETSDAIAAFHKYDKDGDYTIKYTVSNDCGSTDTSFNILIENLGVNDPLIGKLSIMPNPTSSAVEITLSNNSFGLIHFELTDLNGRIILSQDIDKSQETISTPIDMSHLISGAYLISIYSDQGNVTRRIIKSE